MRAGMLLLILAPGESLIMPEKLTAASAAENILDSWSESYAISENDTMPALMRRVS